jgi:putative addiction module component (TIGR02574 family)
MATAKKLDKEIADYLTKLNTKQKKAALTIIKSFIEEPEVEYMKRDKITEAEIERRLEEMESGKVKGLSIQEMKARLEQRKAGKKK